MHELNPLFPSVPEILLGAAAFLVPVAVFVASFRRNRLLFGRSVGDSILIALVSAAFWPVWVVISIVTWQQTRAGWARHRRSHQRDRTLTTA